MLNMVWLWGGLVFVAFGIITGQALLVKFARNVNFKDDQFMTIVTNALQTPYLYVAVGVYACAILTYLYISRLITFTTLNVSLVGLILVFTMIADILIFKNHATMLQVVGTLFILAGLAFTAYGAKLL